MKNKAMHQEYRSHWEAAGYSPKMGSAAVTLPPPRDYIRLYHITSAEHAISDIALGHIKVARFADANDPFELMALRYIQRTRFHSFKSGVDATTGMLCFSEDWKDPVMWAHYGDRHRGICLGFNVRRSIEQEVKYDSERLTEELGRKNGKPEDLSADLQEALKCTKFSSWGYEREHRVFVQLADVKRSGALCFRPFDLDLQLAEVILGPSCSQPLEAVRKLAADRQPDAIAYCSRLARGHFAVVPEELTVP